MAEDLEEDYEAVKDTDSERCGLNVSKSPQFSDTPLREQSGVTFDPNSKTS